jgi:vacuolar protein sorting-associated protein 13A/C
MLERQLLFYLKQYLGKYVDGLDADALKISVWAGDVELRNLSLKPEALADLDLPVTVRAGLLGKLTLKVKWVHGEEMNTCMHHHCSYAG